MFLIRLKSILVLLYKGWLSFQRNSSIKIFVYFNGEIIITIEDKLNLLKLLLNKEKINYDVPVIVDNNPVFDVKFVINVELLNFCLLFK